MNIILAVILILAILAAISFGVYYYLEHYGRRSSSDEEDYIWVGQGEQPLKEMRKKEWEK